MKEKLKSFGKFALKVMAVLVVMGLFKAYVAPKLPVSLRNLLGYVGLA